MSQGFAFQQFRDDVRRALVRISVIDNQNVWMIERSGSASLLFKAIQSIGIIGENGWQNLNCNIGSQSRISRAINFTHPARANWRENFVLPKLYAGCEAIGDHLNLTSKTLHVLT